MMEPGKMGQQMVTFQKTVFDSSFNAMSMVLDQTEQMTESYMKQLSWVPEENKKAMGDAIGFYKKAREDFKKAVYEGFDKMEEMFKAK